MSRIRVASSKNPLHEPDLSRRKHPEKKRILRAVPRRGDHKKTRPGRVDVPGARHEPERRYSSVFHSTSVLPRHFSMALKQRFSLSCSTGQGREVVTMSATPSSLRSKTVFVTACR